MARTAHRGRLGSPWFWSSLLAAALFAVAFVAPLWRMTLKAPQYPQGLHLIVYANHMTGDIDEISLLNHYVGVKTIEPEGVFELKMFPIALGAFVVALFGGAFTVSTWGRRFLGFIAWSFPIGMLLDLQWWLYRYGHDIDPEAPLRFGTFTPKVIGSTNMVNFRAEAMISLGFIAMVLGALVLAGGPWIYRRIVRAFPSDRVSLKGSTVAGGMLLFLMAPSVLTPRSAGAQPTLSELLAQAQVGDVIVVPSGLYQERIVIDKRVTLIGEDWPVIDGGRDGDVLQITADNVTLQGFVIRNSGRSVSDEPAGIRVQGHGNTLENNRLENVLYGIVIDRGGDNTVRGNTVISIRDFPTERRGHGLSLWHTTGNQIEQNRIDTAKDGLFVSFSSNNQIEGNVVTHVRYGIHYMYSAHNRFSNNIFRESLAGAALMYSDDLTLSGNEFAFNRSAASGFGLLFMNVDHVQMVGNWVHHNRLGIKMENAPSSPDGLVTLQNNLIGFNQIGLELSSTTSAMFTGNTFVGNLLPARGSSSVAGRNTWSLDGQGNYWDTYQGYDANADGRGDVPYRLVTPYDSMLERNEALWAFAFTPAQTVLEMASRWFPVFRPPPVAFDPSPLMSPPVLLPSSNLRRNVISRGMLGSASLLALPGATYLLSRAGTKRKWTAC